MAGYVTTLIALSIGYCGIALADEKVKSEAPQPTTQSIMQSIFDPMTTVLGLSFGRDAFSDTKNKAEITREIDKLVKNVEKLELHGKKQERIFEYVAKSLGRDARTVQRLFAKGDYEQAQFTLHNMTENCISCHSNYPESRKFPDAEKFFGKVQPDALSPLDLAYFQVMTRRFDDALTTYETYFSSKKLDPNIVTMLGSLTDYLKLSISVKSDFKRPQALLESIAARPTTLPHVKQQLQRWVVALKDFASRNVLQTITVAAGRKVLSEGRALMEFPRDRDGLIQYLTAEAILTRYIHSHPDGGADVGEAYYLLGIASALTEHSFWITRSDFYLESAIRLAPGAAFAPKAYALLEESLTVSYTGSGGTHIPPDVSQLLNELKRIVQQEHGKI